MFRSMLVVIAGRPAPVLTWAPSKSAVRLKVDGRSS
jgi:hypothetical protein